MRSKPPANTASRRPVRQPRTASRTSGVGALAVAPHDRRPVLARPVLGGGDRHAHAPAVVAAAPVGDLQHVEPVLGRQRPQRREPRHRRVEAELAARPVLHDLQPHPAFVGPGAVHGRHPRPELRVALHADAGVGGLSRGERVQRLAQQEQPLRGAADDRGGRPAGAAHAVQQRLGGAQAGLHPVAQLDAGQDRRAPFVLPEPRLGHLREQRVLGRDLGLDPRRSRPRTPLRAGPARRRLRAPACAASSRPGWARPPPAHPGPRTSPSGHRARRGRTGTGRRSARRGRRWRAPKA